MDLKFLGEKGQDEFVIKEIFKYKKNGYFVDLAATNGVKHNNTYLLESKLNWNGICIEPNKKYFNDLKKNRKCHVNNNIIYSSSGKLVEFRYDNGELGGIISDDKSTDNYYLNQNEIRCKNKETVNKKNASIFKDKTKTLEQILKMYNAPKIIDYLSLDVEGSEYHVLKNFPFNEYTFLCMTIERPQVELNDLLFKNNYIFVRNSKMPWGGLGDTFYLHESIKNDIDIPLQKFEQVPCKK